MPPDHIVAVSMTAIIGSISLLRREKQFRATAKPFVYLIAPLIPMLGLPAIGEGSYRLASDEKTAQPITVPFDGRARSATLLALGKDTMVYRLDDCLYLSGPRGEGPLKLGCDRKAAGCIGCRKLLRDDPVSPIDPLHLRARRS
ncbi:hypothetical protein RLDS_07030 [Sphingobium lactosutens DS20]|jgi:hypothetical protein|uniref:Uncharacterized protein n=2 Tax=Sphingobium TaxID=165695 RepID=T0J3L3_9SPHN|nr:hypothetical protein RLDS_07030 [Sphingobium lactosutens DS20]